jgi:hypothetical protein
MPKNKSIESTTCVCAYSTIETKETALIGYSWLLFPHEYSGEGRGNETNFQIEQIVLLISLSKCVIFV